MAYGVKYRLDFSDAQGNKRRLEILKKDYSDTVFPLIGTGSPVVLSWEQNNDFYDPLIASNCEVNLIQTDFVVYEDFYDFDEREFLVKVYYAETRVPFWEDKTENWELSNDYWGDESEVWNTIAENWNDYSVGWQQGITSDNYRAFWQGYLIQDTYEQSITSTPFNVSFKAVDGLGLLKGVDFPLTPNNEVTLWECLHKVLLETGLTYNIYVKTDLKEENAAAVTNVFEDLTINTSTYTDENTYKYNCSEVLFSILSGFNCRIFQTDADFYIINNADLATLENIDYRRYNSEGVYVENIIKNTFISIPTEGLPVSETLIKETSGGVIEVKSKVLLSEQINFIPNGNFEDGFENWSFIDPNNVELSTNGIRGQSIKIIGTDSSFVRVLQNEFYAGAKPYLDSVFDFSFVIQMENGGYPLIIASYSVPYQLLATFRRYSGGEPTSDFEDFYFNDQTNEWQSSEFTNQFNYAGRGEWLTYNKEIAYNITDVTSGYLPLSFIVNFGQPSTTSPFHVAMYLGGSIINWKNLLYVKTATAEPEKFIFSGEDLETVTTQTTTKKLTNKLEYKDIYQGSTFNQFLKGYMAPVGDEFKGVLPMFKRSSDINYRFIEDLAAQQRINDNRVKIQRYDGSIKKLNNEIPIFLHNRLKIEFVNLIETLPLVIDTLKFNVKSNIYDFSAHLGNQLTDAVVDFKANQISYSIPFITNCKTYRVQNDDQNNSITYSYYDCDMAFQTVTLQADSDGNDFCATTRPSVPPNANLIDVDDTCTVSLNFYLLQKCSDSSTGYKSAQYTNEITLGNNRRVQDSSLVNYTIIGQGVTGSTVGTITDAGVFGCPVPVELTSFQRSNNAFPNPCEQVPDITAYHDGAGTYPTIGDVVYTTANTTSPLANGSYLMVNAFYFTISGGVGEVQSVTECSAPANEFYALQKCSDGSTGWRTAQQNNQIALSNNDRVAVGSVNYIVTGITTSGTSVGNVTTTGQTGCPSTPTLNYYSLIRCSDGSTGWRTEQQTSAIALSNNDRVQNGVGDDYRVSGTTTSGTSVGTVTNTGQTGCPSAPTPFYYTLERCSDNTTGWRSEQTTAQISLNTNDRVTVGAQSYIVTGTSTNGSSVGSVTDTGQTGCPIPEPVYYSLTSCADGSTNNRTQQETTQITLSNNDRVSVGSIFYTVNGTTTTGTNVGNVTTTGQTGCPIPDPVYYSLTRCSDSGTGFRSNQQTSAIALSNNDRVSVSSVFYTVTGTTTSGTNAGTVTDTGQTGCPSYYSLTRCSDSVSGFRTAQQTSAITLINGDRVSVGSVFYIVTGTTITGTSVGTVTDTGFQSCPTTERFYNVFLCSDPGVSFVGRNDSSEILANGSSLKNGNTCYEVGTETTTSGMDTNITSWIRYNSCTSCNAAPPGCPDRVMVFQVCNSNSEKDDNFDVYLNGTYIGFLNLNSDSRVGSVFIGSTNANYAITQPDFVCPLNLMQTYRFDPSIILYGNNTIELRNAQNNGRGNFGSIGVRNYQLVGNSLENPCDVADITFSFPSGENFTTTFSYTECCP